MSLTIAALVLFGFSVWLFILRMNHAYQNREHKAHRDAPIVQFEQSAVITDSADGFYTDVNQCAVVDIGAPASCDSSF
jgi:hypothetical protein